jgi:hypothetical protein
MHKLIIIIIIIIIIILVAGMVTFECAQLFSLT